MLYERGFYKRLHVYTNYIPQHHLDKMFFMPFVNSMEMLHGIFRHIDIYLENLNTLGIKYGFYIENMDNLPSKLPNLGRIYFFESSSDHVFPFVRLSTKQRAVKLYRLQGGSHCSKGFFDLTIYNKERTKLT